VIVLQLIDEHSCRRRPFTDSRRRECTGVSMGEQGVEPGSQSIPFVPIPCPIQGIWSVTGWTVSYEKDSLMNWADVCSRS
jgi:hypothetical protein